MKQAHDLDTLLSDIGQIRAQLDSGARFQGLTPATVAATGLLALALAAGQQAFLYVPADVVSFFGQWILMAIISALLIGTDAVVRARIVHQALAERLIDTTLRHFLPSALAGAILAAVFLVAAPSASWALPGLWALLIGISVYPALANLPRLLAVAGVWYFVAGTFALTYGASVQIASPWMMGLPFGIGQLLAAALLWYSARENSHD